MMYSIISDIHSNYTALKKVISEIDRLGVKDIINAGDIIGYGCYPNECVDLIRERKIPSVLGNHDAMAIGKMERSWFNAPARMAVERNYHELTPENREFIKKLKPAVMIDNILVVHAQPPKDYIKYLHNAEEAIPLMKNMKQKICIFGHTHVPAAIRYEAGSAKEIIMDKVKLDKSAKYMLNPGSVGQPRDGNPKASFAVLNDNSFGIRRINYNIKEIAKEMKERGYPSYFYERLEKGE